MNGFITMIQNLVTVVKSWALNVGKLFFSDEPEEVTMKMLDENTNEPVDKPVKNLAMIKQEFEEWKETVRPILTNLNNRLNNYADQIGIKLNIGSKINTGINYYGMYGIGDDLVKTYQYPAGYLITPNIHINTGEQVRAEIELVADGYLTKGILTLKRESNDFLYSTFTLTGSEIMRPVGVDPIPPFIGQGVAVKDGYGDDEKSVRLIWVIGGSDETEVPIADIGEISNFYGRIRYLDSAKLFDLEEFI